MLSRLSKQGWRRLALINKLNGSELLNAIACIGVFLHTIYMIGKCKDILHKIANLCNSSSTLISQFHIFSVIPFGFVSGQQM